MTEDRRRRQYVPLSVHFAAGHTGQELQKRFGLEGLGAWACLLAAAKRSPIQGSVEWYCDEDGWRQLRISTPPGSFTFSDFVKVLGRLHLAKTTKRGEVKTTSIRAWNEWNSTVKREQDAEKKRRKRAQITGDNEAPFRGTEVEGEGETPLTPRRRRTTRANGTNGASHQKHQCPHCGYPFDTAEFLKTHLEWGDCADLHRQAALAIRATA